MGAIKLSAILTWLLAAFLLARQTIYVLNGPDTYASLAMLLAVVWFIAITIWAVQWYRKQKKLKKESKNGKW